MIRLILFALASVIYLHICGQGLTQTNPHELGMSASRLKSIDDLFAKWIDEKKIPGGVVLVARKGKIAYFNSFGNRNLEENTPFDKDDIFRIASMTKGITTTAVLQLYEKGLFGLDDPISNYIPAFKEVTVLDQFNELDSSYTTLPVNTPITIRHLLTHTSGIPYGFMDSEINAIFTKNGFVNFGLSHETATTQEMVELVAKQPLLHQPGDNWSYGHNTDILGYFVEVVSGKTLGEYCREYILEPLGMKDTYFYLPEEKISRLVPIYADNGNGNLEKWDWEAGNYPTYGRDDHFAGGGGLSSTAMDYARFCQMLLNGGIYNDNRILSRKTIELMNSNQLDKMNITPRSLLGKNGNSFGLGFALITDKSTSHAHGSSGTFYWGGIFNTRYWIDPREELLVVIMAQILPFPGNDIWNKLSTIIYSSIDD